MSAHKNLILFTNAFPTSFSQENYLIDEIPFLANRFERVAVVPIDRETVKHKLPGNTIVDYLDQTNPMGVLSKTFTILKYLPLVIREYMKPQYSVKDLGTLVREVLIARHYANCILVFIKKHAMHIRETVFYTYWCNTYTLSLAFLKEANPNLKFVSRAHQADVYLQVAQKAKTSFYDLKLKMLLKLFVISEHGAGYLAKKYPEHFSKIKRAYLGVEDNGENPVNNAIPFTIVSVSKFGDNKRVFRIPEILNQLDFPVKWVHFGWGGADDVGKVSGAIARLNKNVTAELAGMMPNNEILDYYRNNPVNLFINVSVIEGLSFAAIEALSFGIPLLLTNTNAAPELIGGNGFVVPVNFRAEEVASLITQIHDSDQHVMRDRSRNMFLDNFNARKNYSEFVAHISSS